MCGLRGVNQVYISSNPGTRDRGLYLYVGVKSVYCFGVIHERINECLLCFKPMNVYL